MDLHKRLNAMQVELAEETVDGAAVYNLAEADRPLVAAFMSGLNRTAKLKFSHPGLATTATRTGGRLAIRSLVPHVRHRLGSRDLGQCRGVGDQKRDALDLGGVADHVRGSVDDRSCPPRGRAS